MSNTYTVNPWSIPELKDYPVWPFHDLNLWYLGTIPYEIGIKEEGFSIGDGFASGIKRVYARDAFLCSGILMSPTTYNGSSRAWGFFLEHIESLRNSPGILRINEDFVHWEERVRTTFIERFSLGLAGLLLWQEYEVLHIADAGPFIAKTLNDPSSPYNRKGLQSLKLYGKNGGYKPDLFCLTSYGECVIAESKGAVGPPSKLTSAKKKGKDQVKNVEPHGVNVRKRGGRLVFATNLRHEAESPRNGKDSCITVVDPERNDDAIYVKVTENEIVLHSYCKLLSLCGLSKHVHQLLNGYSINIQGKIIEIGNYKIVPLLIRENQVIGIEAMIANTLFNNGSDLASKINTLINQLEIDSGYSSENGFMLPNGVIFSKNYKA